MNFDSFPLNFVFLLLYFAIAMFKRSRNKTVLLSGRGGGGGGGVGKRGLVGNIYHYKSMAFTFVR